MCMFCVIQKWSRRVATMLPWLVIPLIGLWALSQMLPPPFRFEITSPRLACVFVLLITLFWYEVLMPHLSAWRVRRNAFLREKKRIEALELQKLKKTATRKCRNCLTPYRDQNPGGGKFMCSYCGHISKRPVLELPITPGMGISNSGIIKDLLGKGGKILNRKPWADNFSICNQEWLENGRWVVNGSFSVKSTYTPQRSDVSFYGGSQPCLGEKSYSGAYFFACKLLTSLLVSIRWLWNKFFWFVSAKDDSSSDANHRGMLAKRGENSSTGPESRGERARRKAEEKRQARIEKEILEEEERKQREEVARLVEERRRLRDEKTEAENRAKGTCSLREKDSKKEVEKKRQERRKEKDKVSSKSNSDVEDFDKKVGKESERKRDAEKKTDADRREFLRTGLDNVKGPDVDSGMYAKGNPANSYTRGHVGSRYIDRMRGTFFSSSKALTDGSFFGKAPAPQEVKSNSSLDISMVSNSRSDTHQQDHSPVKAIHSGDDKSNFRQVTSDTQHKTAPRSWQQLFTRSPAAPTAAPSHSNVISRPSAKYQVEIQSPQPPCSGSSAQLYDNPINLPSPFVLPFSSRPMVSSGNLSAIKDPVIHSVAERRHDLLPEEPEFFEDPCYEPDPVSLLGPVSESLDNFQLDLGNSRMPDELRESYPSVSASSPLAASRISPFESPLSRQKAASEKNQFPDSPKAIDMYSFPSADVNNVSDQGTWHMWSSSPLGPESLSLVGGPPSASWNSPLERSRLSNGDGMHYLPQKTLASLFTQNGNIASGTHSSPMDLTENAQPCTPFGPPIPNSNEQEPWMQSAFYPSLSDGEDLMPMSPTQEVSQKKTVYESPNNSATNHAFDSSTPNCWPKKDWAIQGSGECVRNPSIVKAPIGGLYSPSDVHSLWSFK